MSSSDSELTTYYIMTIYHHNEDFTYFINYYIPQINYITCKLLSDNLAEKIKLHVYVFTSVDLSIPDNICNLFNSNQYNEINYSLVDQLLHNGLTPGSTPGSNYKKINCDHIVNRILNKTDIKYDVNVLIKTYKINGLYINFVNILPYEYNLLKIIFPQNTEEEIIFNKELELIKNQINWNNNSIGAKRFVSQSLAIDLSNQDKYKNKNKNEFFHWQSDLYIKIGVPSYAKHYNNENEQFVCVCNDNFPIVPEIAKFLYIPPDFINNNNDIDLGDIIIRNDNSELYTFIIAHYQYKNFIDHFTLGQQDIGMSPQYKNIKLKIKLPIKQVSSPKCFEKIIYNNNTENSIYGLNYDKSTSPYKPKFKFDNKKLTINSHYDKFYITNIQTVKITKTYYNPLFTDWSEDIFFTALMQKSNFTIIPFYLLTYSIPKKITKDFILVGGKKTFEHITFKIFGAYYSPQDISNSNLNIIFNVPETYIKVCDNKQIIHNGLPCYDVSLNYKTNTLNYDIKRGLMLFNIAVFFIDDENINYWNTDNKSQKAIADKIDKICKIPILKNINMEKIIKYDKNIISQNGIFINMLKNKIYDGVSPNCFETTINNLINNNLIRISKEKENHFITFIYLNEYLKCDSVIKQMYNWNAVKKTPTTIVLNDNDNTNTIIYIYMKNVYDSLICLNKADCDLTKKNKATYDGKNTKPPKTQKTQNYKQGGSYEEKYLKYKHKYLNLKNNIVSQFENMNI
jgi:hypothetical protein